MATEAQPNQTSNHPINTDAGILAYLTRTSPTQRYISAERLTGGAVNHVWRVVVATPSTPSTTTSPGETGEPEQSTVVVKHAEPFVRQNPGVAFPTDRMDFEARLLSLVPSILDDSEGQASRAKASTSKQGHEIFGVRVPRVLNYSSAHHVLTISDAGHQTLKEAYARLSKAQIQSIGARLGKWLARLHARSGGVDIGPAGNTAARAIYRYAYQHLAGTLERSGVVGSGGWELGRRVDERFGRLLLTDDACVAHGDFWPGNMLVGDGFWASDSDCDSDGLGGVAEVVPITVVDWEMTRRGDGATDVAQFTAEAYMLDRFRDANHGLSGAFLRSYVAETTPSEEFWQKLGVHWGVHVCFWPSRVNWAGAHETRKLGELGIKVIEMAMAGGHERLAEFLLNSFDNAQ